MLLNSEALLYMCIYMYMQTTEVWSRAKLILNITILFTGCMGEIHVYMRVIRYVHVVCL